MKKYKNHLNQEFTATRPNEIWVSDVACLRYKEKGFYICAILDLYSRAVAGFHISHKNSTQLTKGTFKQAYENCNPESSLLFHTDRGANYRSKTFCSYLKSLGVNQSFSRPHVPYGNSVMESFFSSLKREELYKIKQIRVLRQTEKDSDLFLAPQVGLEPTTLRLTAACSTD